MSKIIYTSDKKIEWDAQSAFKVTNYYTDNENCMVFCYLKLYVQNGDLKLCTFCFDKEAAGKNDLQLCFNLNPEKDSKYLHTQFGIDGIANLYSVQNGTPVQQCCDGITYHSFKSNDQQGFYWCGEITLSKDFIRTHFNTYLDEKSIILLNLYKIFPSVDDYGCLFPDKDNILTEKSDCMEEFVVLKY